MNVLKLFLTVFVLSLGYLQPVFSGETLNTKIHNQYVSLRALGMGNAFTAVADDYSLIFYNPAGFAKKKNNELQMTFAGTALNMKTVNMVKDLDAASKVGTTDEQKAQSIATALEPYYGKAVGARIQAVELFWIRKNWGVALIPIDLSLDMTINKQVGPSIDLNVKGDTTLAYGYGAEINKELSWGVTAKGIHRVSADENLPVLELAANSNVLSEERMKEGIGGDLDIGLLYTPGWFVKKEKRKPQQVNDKKLADKAQAGKEPVSNQGSSSAEVVNAENIEQQTQGKTSSVSKADEIQINDDGAQAAASGTVTKAQIDQVASTELIQPTSGTVSTVAAATASSTTPVSATAKLKAEDAQDNLEKSEDQIVDENYPLTFSFVARNLVGGKFVQSKLVNKKAIDVPDKMPTVIDLGSQYEISKFGSLVIRTMLDFKNILHPQITLNKSLHAGLELDFSPSGWFKTQLRGGVNQGYYTAGATLLLGIFNIEAATYGEEVGTSSTKLENRIYAAKFGMNF